MKSAQITLTASSGATFTAWLDTPAGGRPAACALLIHCFPPGSAAGSHISLAFTQNRYEVLRLSAYESTSLLSHDLLEAAYHFLKQERQAPVLAVGHSLAGALLLEAATQWPELRAVATVGAPATDTALHTLLDEELDEDERVLLAYQQAPELAVDVDLLDVLHEPQVEKRLSSLPPALLFLHSPQDREISIDSAAYLYSTARHPKSFVTLDGADHFLNKPADSLYTGNLIAAWVQRYIELPADTLRTHMEVVTRTQGGGFTTEIRAGEHSLLADEPLKVGGLNLGPTPYDLLNAALGACTSMTLQMYAARKKWPLQEAIVHLKHDRVYVEDCQACEAGTGKLDQINREVELVGPLDEAQRKRLLEIADKCPVHRTLEGEIRVKTAEVPPRKPV